MGLDRTVVVLSAVAGAMVEAGRPCYDRAVLNGILWILRSGARWKDLPARFPSCQACHRRFQRWVEDGTLPRQPEESQNAGQPTTTPLP